MLTDAIERYVELRQTAGFEIKAHIGQLGNFARFAADRSETHVKKQTAIDWAAQAPTPYQRENRLGIVRCFARHARAEDSAHEEIPEKVFASGRRKRRFPDIFSPEELLRLLEATVHLRPKTSLRPLTYYTLFGLLAVTGLRISEAMHLTLDDVTDDGLLIRETKFRKNRLVPLHDTTQEAVKHYIQQREAVGGIDDRVFISTKGRGLTYPMIIGTFHYLVKRASLNVKSGQPPRIHDLRHLYAVRALESSPEGYEAATRHILAVSTYLGHAHVADTYWYLQSTPYLVKSIADACQRFIQGGQR